jgi:hypothetical protein
MKYPKLSQIFCTACTKIGGVFMVNRINNPSRSLAVMADDWKDRETHRAFSFILLDQVVWILKDPTTRTKMTFHHKRRRPRGEDTIKLLDCDSRSFRIKIRSGCEVLNEITYYVGVSFISVIFKSQFQGFQIANNLTFIHTIDELAGG